MKQIEKSTEIPVNLRPMISLLIDNLDDENIWKWK